MRKFLLFLILAFLLMIFDQLGIVRSIRGGVEKILLPIEEKLFFLKKREEPQILIEERKIANLEAQISSLKKENADMRRLLGAPLPSSWQFLPAKVIGISEGVLILDKGRSDGVFLNQPAIVENVFVGKIFYLGEHISHLKTLQSQKLKIQAVVKDKNAEWIKARGILSSFGGKIFLDKVLLSENFEIGDLVFTASSQDIPQDLLIGKVKEISSDKLFRKAEVEPFLSFGELEEVFLLILK